MGEVSDACCAVVQLANYTGADKDFFHIGAICGEMRKRIVVILPANDDVLVAFVVRRNAVIRIGFQVDCDRNVALTLVVAVAVVVASFSDASSSSSSGGRPMDLVRVVTDNDVGNTSVTAAIESVHCLSSIVAEPR